MICRISAAHKLHQGSFIRLAEPYSHSGEERKTRLRVCIFVTFDKSNKTFPKKFAISCRIRHSLRIRKKCLHTWRKRRILTMERTISFMNGKGSIGHNTRSFIADNVDASRTKNNITLIHEDIKQVYHKLFDNALDEYNAKQKRKDRQIKSYYDKISRSKQEKLFYEVIVQIGNRDDTGVGSSSAEVATWVLKDYVKKFQLRNLQLYVIGAYIHLDEETPHLHLNFIPWVSGCKRGLETKTSLKAALATRGFVSEGKGNTEWRQWRRQRKRILLLL